MSRRCDLEELLQHCGELASPQQLSSLLETLGDVDASQGGATDGDAGRASRYLLGCLSSDRPVPLDDLARDLESRDDVLGNAAALYFVQQLADDQKAQSSLLLGADAYTSPALDRVGRWRLVRMMGWSQDQRFVSLLLEILKHHYHFYAPDYVAEALRHLNALPDPREVPYDRSITVSASGSQLVIHHDARFSGRSCCVDCEFMPCRVNRYYRGAIEDCKLFRRQDPDSLHELVDYRSDAADDPATVGLSERSRQKRLEELIRWAAESEGRGRFAAAADQLRQAIRHAPHPNAHLDLVARAVRLKIRAGDRQGAFALLKLSEDKLRDASDERVLRRFDAAILALEEELGGYVEPEIRTLGSAESKELAKLYRRLRQAPGNDEAELRRLMASIIRQLRRAREEGLDPHWWLRRLLSLSQVLGYYRPAELLIARLSSLQSAHEEEALGWEMASARLLSYVGERCEARNRFAALLPRVRNASNPERRLEYYADYLEALGMAAEDGGLGRELVQLPLRLSQSSRELFRRLLAEQPGAAARRRFRERHQRTLENALCGLLETARAAGSESFQGQALLSEAWFLIMTARNPELQTVRPQLSRDEVQRLGNLEDSLHRGLSYMLIHGMADWRLWQFPAFLQRVVDFELSTVDHRRVPEEGAHLPPASGRAVTFFELKDRAVPEALLVLTHGEDRFTCHLVEDARRTLFDPLVAWARSELVAKDFQLRREWEGLEKMAALILRDFEPIQASRGDDARIPDAEELRTLAGRILPLADGSKGEGEEALQTWFLYPDGPLNQIPVELLPSGGATSRLFETVGIRHVLRSVPQVDFSDRLVDLKRGWLGLGGIPEHPGFRKLDWTRKEVESIAADLAGAGCRGSLLVGDEAHVENLTKSLQELHPAVLHFACHGYADLQYPDASCLVLAMEPGGAAGELLPFRLIRDLPLEGVELVVLSACSGQVGPRGMGAEGLAWAFLDAGVPRVVASRYSVGDQATAALMRRLYHHLLRRPVAEALRQTRLEGLTASSIAVGDLAVWCLWE